MRKKLIALFVCACACALFLFRACDEGRVTVNHDPDLLQVVGMSYGPPYFRFHGKKPKEMNIEAWVFYSTMSPACRGMDILAGRTEEWYGPGSPEYRVKGRATKAHFIPRGKDAFELVVPIGLNDKPGCAWRMFELIFYAWHPFTDRDRRRKTYDARSSDLIMFSFAERDDDSLFPMRERYDVLCRKIQWRTFFEGVSLECAYPGYSSQYTYVGLGALQSGGDIELNVTVSDDIDEVR